MIDLRLSLEESGLLVAKQAASAIDSGWKLSQFKGDAGGREGILDLHRTYEVRLKILRSHIGPHAKQLASSVEEFLVRLQSLRRVEVAHLEGPAEYTFVIWRDPDTSSIAGVFRVVSQLDVSSERWDELWKDSGGVVA
jgi:hypothetical protein